MRVLTVGASLSVLPDDSPGLSAVIGQRKFTRSTAVARRLDAGLGRELFVVDAKGPESHRDDVPGLERGHGPLGVATAGEFFTLEADPGVDGVAQVLGPGSGLGARVRDGHVGRGRAEAREQGRSGQESAAEKGGGFHIVWPRKVMEKERERGKAAVGRCR